MADLGATAGSVVSFSDLQTVEDAPALSAKNSASLLEEFEIEVEEKVKQMRSLTDRLALRLHGDFQMELLKLPKDIRSMTMQEFCVQFGGDVDEALKHQSKRSKLMPPPPPVAALQQPGTTSKARAQPAAADGPKTARKTRGAAAGAETPQPSARASRSRAGAGAATPAGRGMQTPGAMSVPSTPMFTPRLHETPRVAQRGEILLSQNGSPINVLDGVQATIKKGRTDTAINLRMADGKEIDLTAGGARALLPDEESRAQALTQLDALEKQVQAIKGSLKGQ